MCAGHWEQRGGEGEGHLTEGADAHELTEHELIAERVGPCEHLRLAEVLAGVARFRTPLLQLRRVCALELVVHGGHRHAPVLHAPAQGLCEGAGASLAAAAVLALDEEMAEGLELPARQQPCAVGVEHLPRFFELANGLCVCVRARARMSACILRARLHFLPFKPQGQTSHFTSDLWSSIFSMSAEMTVATAVAMTRDTTHTCQARRETPHTHVKHDARHHTHMSSTRVSVRRVACLWDSVRGGGTSGAGGNAAAEYLRAGERQGRETMTEHGHDQEAGDEDKAQDEPEGAWPAAIPVARHEFACDSTESEHERHEHERARRAAG